MKSQKVTVKIEMESLSIDVLQGMVAEVVSQISREIESGSMVMQDGDCIKWSTVREDVEF